MANGPSSFGGVVLMMLSTWTVNFEIKRFSYETVLLEKKLSEISM